MADAALKFLIENAAQLVKEKASLIAGAKEELEQLKKDLDSLKAFLRDATKRPKKSEGFRNFERLIRNVVYKAEDTIDSCMIRAATVINMNAFNKIFSSFDLADEVKKLRNQDVINMVKEVTKIGLGSEASQQELPPKPLKVKLSICSNFHIL